MASNAPRRRRAVVRRRVRTARPRKPGWKALTQFVLRTRKPAAKGSPAKKKPSKGNRPKKR